MTTYNNQTFENQLINVPGKSTFMNCIFHSNVTFGDLRDITFSNCQFLNNQPNFMNIKLDNIKFINTNISNGKFVSAFLSNMNLSSISLSTADFTNANIQTCGINFTDLTNAILKNIYTRNLISSTTLLPPSWKVITVGTNNVLIGPTANLRNIKMDNINLDHMNLSGINLTNSRLTRISIQGTTLDNAVLRYIQSSEITGTPKSLPIGVTIFNKQFFYTQDDIYIPEPIVLASQTIITNTVVPQILSSNDNLIYSGIIQNSEQHLLVYLSEEPIDPSELKANTIHIYDIQTNTLLSTVQIPNFFITSLTSQSMTYGKGAFLFGYGYHESILNPLKYLSIRLDPNGQLDPLYEGTGYKIQEIDNQMYPSGYTEIYQNPSTFYYMTQGDDKMIISKMNFEYLMDCSGIDFSGKNISGIDLSGRNFTNCDFSGTNLSYCNLTNANFTNANIYKTNLSYSILNNVDLTGAIFFQPNFTGIYLSSSTAEFVLPNGFKFVNNYFIGPGLNLEGIDLSGVNLSNVNFQGSNLTNAILTNTKVWGTKFTNAILNNVTTGGMTGTPILPSSYKIINRFIVGPYVNLTNANLSEIDLTDMNVVGTNMSGTNLTNTILKNVISGEIKGTPIISATTKFINGYLVSKESLNNNSDLSGGDLSGADLTDTTLTNTNFYNVTSRNIIGDPILSSSYQVRDGYLVGPNVNMSGLDLSGVNLSDISMTGMNVDGTDLRYTNLTNITSGGLRGTPILDSKYKLYNQYIVGPNVNLNGADLSGIDLSGMNLDGTNLENANLIGIRSGFIEGTPIVSSKYKLMKGYIVGPEVDLRGANLEWQDFSDMDLFRTDFTDAKLNHATFHRSFIFDTNFTNIEFRDIRSSGLIGIPSYLPEELDIMNSFIQGRLSRIFVGPSIKLENIEFRDQNMNSIDLSGSELINVYFNNTSIDSTNFNRTNLLGIRSLDVSGTPTNLSSKWRIVNGYLIGPNANLMSADFTNLDLSGVNLSDVNLLNVHFENTTPGPIEGIPILDFDWKVVNLRFDTTIRPFIIGPGINLSGMDLSSQVFINMNLANINLEQTNLSNATLRNISSGGIIGSTELLPEGWKIVGGYLIGPTANLSNSDLEAKDLTNVNLSYAVVTNSNLNSSDLTGANLMGIKSGNVKGYPILPEGWRIINGYLIGPSADVTDADLSGSDLSGIDLSGTNFSRSNLTNVNFTNTNITNANFMGANLTNITPMSIYENIDLTGAILPENNYLQYNYFISNHISMSDYLSMKYKELKQRVFMKIFSGQDVRKDISISLIKRLNLKIYDDLYILYSESSNGTKDTKYFDQLTLFDIDTRFQMYQRTLTLINNMTYIDEFLLRLINRFDIETIPESILRNINFSLVLPETVAMFYMKHLFDSKFHSMILSQSVILDKVTNFFRKSSKIYDDNLFVQNLYGVTNNSIDQTYQNIVKRYRYQVEQFENYLYIQDIINKYTNASKISTLFRKIVDLDPKFVTPVLFDLFKKSITILFGPLTQRDDFDLYKLNANRLFVSYDLEKHLVSEFISKNQTIVQSMFNIEPKLGEMWTEIKRSNPDVHIFKRLYPWIDTLDTAIIYFRRQLFSNIKNMTYTYVYPNDITETVLTMRENKLDSMVNMSDENIDVVSEYLKDNQFIQRILQNPKQFIKDIESPSFSSVQDIKKLYGLSLYSTPQIKEKIIQYDIRIKLEQDENRYVQLFAGLSTNLMGDENLVAPLEEYRRIWNIIMN